MSIASEITRLQGCKANIRTALVNKGITSASTHNMADFATDISNISEGGATITVTYISSFYNKTITCSNGTKTYTKTTTSSGSTVFNVTEEGTWTITCNGVSRTVNVVLNYSTQMAVTKTITVYGAVGATISFTDAVGSKTVTLNSSGQGSVSITFIPPSQSITFTDTNKAKNPDNLSQNYSKSITITESTTSIKVMPDGALYWYGWGGTELENAISSNGWSYPGYTFNTPTWNTNSIYCLIQGASRATCVGSKNKITSGKTVNVLVGSNTSQSSNSSLIYAQDVKAATSSSNVKQSSQLSVGKTSLQLTGNYYLRIGTIGPSTAVTFQTTINGIWLE